MAVPKLRFPEFTDDWEQRKLGDIASSFAYGLNAAAKEFDGKHKYLRITDIDDVSRVFQDDNLTSPDADIDAADDYRLEEGDLLFARTGASVGKSYIYKESDGLVYYAGFLIRAKIRPEYDAEFVFQNTLTSTYEKYIKTTSQRSGQPGVNAKEYAEYSMSLPEYAEQVKIGMFLRKIDDAITLHQRKLDDIKLLKKSMLQKMFPAEGRDVPEVRFPGFTAAWEQRKVGEVIEDYVEKTTVQNQYPVLTSSQQQGIVLQEDYFADRQVTTNDNVGYYVLPRGYFTYRSRSDTDLFVFNRNNLIDKGIISYYYPVFRPKNVDSNFLLRRLNNGIRSQVSMAAEGTGQHVLAHSKLKNMEFLVPSVPEQKLIGAYFEILDHLITLHQSKAESWKNKKNQLSTIFWEQRKWCDTVDISTEMVDPTSGEYDDMPHIAPGNIESFTGRILDNVKSVKEEQLISGKYRFRPGDVVYGKINPQLGKYFYASVDGLTSADAYVFNGKNGVTQKFLFSLLQTEDFFKYSVSVSKRSGMPKINRDELNAYGFLAPKEEEQEQIGRFLLEIDKLITLHHRKLNRTQICINRSFLYGSF